MSKGRPKSIETPQLMLEHFNAYVKDVKDNPRTKNDFAGKDAEEVIKKLERPLTMEGFENYLFNNDIISDVSDYFEGKIESYKEFLPICRAIKRMIRQDQIEGGMVGAYNPSITQRLNNLVDKQSTDLNIKEYNVTLNVDNPNEPK